MTTPKRESFKFYNQKGKHMNETKLKNMNYAINYLIETNIRIEMELKATKQAKYRLKRELKQAKKLNKALMDFIRKERA